MTAALTIAEQSAGTGVSGLPATDAAALPRDEVLRRLDAGLEGLTGAAAVRRLVSCGPNAVLSHRARWLPVLWNQIRSPLLALLMAAAIASAFVGEPGDAVIITVIVALSVGLGFANDYRAERAAEALRSRITHQAIALRDGRATAVDVATLVPPSASSTGGCRTRRRHAGSAPSATCAAAPRVSASGPA